MACGFPGYNIVVGRSGPFPVGDWTGAIVPSSRTQFGPPITRAILSLLHGETPEDKVAPEEAETCLRRLECGGYLRSLWNQERRAGSLPRGWRTALERAHRKTMLDTLAALADFRAFGRLIEAEGIPFILLKGGCYLLDLYDDLGQRPLTDIDLLVRPSDAPRLRRCLEGAGYATLQWDEEYRRFEMIPPGQGRCSFEVHWGLGLSERNIDQDRVWERSRVAVLEDVSCRRLAPDDALLFHVAHLADHFFGPSLKWVIDLRLMFQRWQLDPESLIKKAAEWRMRTALALSIQNLEKLFPGEAPAVLRTGLPLGTLRRWLLRLFQDPESFQIMNLGDGMLARYSARCVLVDRPFDLFKGATRIVRRSLHGGYEGVH